AIALEGDAAGRVEGEGAVAQENVVILDADRPVRREAELETGADRATPAGILGRSERGAGTGEAGRDEGVVFVADHGAAALHVEQHVVPGVADLACDQAESVDLGAVALCREENADIVAGEVGPVALAFEAEHPAGGLPAIADLA